MKRGFLNNKQKPLYEEFSGPSASHQAIWESLSQRGLTVGVLDITEALENAPREDSVAASAGPGLQNNYGRGPDLTSPNFRRPYQVDSDSNLINRIPSLSVTQGREPSAYCLLWSSTLEKIANAPGYPATLPKTRLPTLVTIKSAPNMGFGLFAKHDIKVSELVLAERPLVVIPQVIPTVYGSLSLSTAEIRRIGNEQYEKSLEEFLGLMRREEVDAFRGLENRYPEDGYKSFGIVQTNGYSMKFGETDNLLTYYAVGNKGSRINHSCTPNLFVDFDIASFTMRYTALRDIKAGEQLFYSYCHPMQPVKARREDLGRYKFVCRCNACESATPESDKARVRYGIDEKNLKVSTQWAKVLLRSEFKGGALKSLLDMEKEVMKEGLDFWLPFPLLLDAIVKVYTKLGDREKVKEYKEKLERYNPAVFEFVKDG